MFKLRFLIFALLAFLPVIALHEYELRSHRSDSIQAHVTAKGVMIPPAVRSLRPNYPYSVVPGGVYSPAELRAAIQKDPRVGEHYADFNLRSAQLVKLTDDHYQYASFRLGNRIFWTNKKLRIPKGEVLVSDGSNYARTRCGNRLSDLPHSDTTPLQPPERLLSLPPFSLELLPQLVFAEAPPVPEIPAATFETPRLTPFLPTTVAPPLTTVTSWPPLQQPPAIMPLSTPPYAMTPMAPNYSGGAGNIPVPAVLPDSMPPAIPPVPEPGTVSLFAVGLLVSLLLLHRMSRHTRCSENRSEQSQN
jgi:hypothetical protein